MTENTLLYTYSTKVCERWDLTFDEMRCYLIEEIENAKNKNFNLIMTGKANENKSFFDAFTAPKLTKNYIWIHFCPQEVLNFDDEKSDCNRYYILTLTGYAKDGLYI